MLGEYGQCPGWMQDSPSMDAHLHLAEAEELLPPARSGVHVAYGIGPKSIAGKRSQVGRSHLAFVFKFIDLRPNEPKAAIKSSLPSNLKMAAMSGDGDLPVV